MSENSPAPAENDPTGRAGHNGFDVVVTGTGMGGCAAGTLIGGTTLIMQNKIGEAALREGTLLPATIITIFYNNLGKAIAKTKGDL